jgi:hypothetical protein
MATAAAAAAAAAVEADSETLQAKADAEAGKAAPSDTSAAAAEAELCTLSSEQLAQLDDQAMRGLSEAAVAAMTDEQVPPAMNRPPLHAPSTLPNSTPPPGGSSGQRAYPHAQLGIPETAHGPTLEHHHIVSLVTAPPHRRAAVVCAADTACRACCLER